MKKKPRNACLRRKELEKKSSKSGDKANTHARGWASSWMDMRIWKSTRCVHNVCVCVVCASAFTKLCKQEFDRKLFYSTFDTLASICFKLLRINLI
jgi:hypothetical protein